jgi:phosphate transport system substrate-binding protein
MKKRFRRMLGGGAIAWTFALSPAQASTIVLNESGSSLIFPLFQSWVAAYRSVDPEVNITAASTDSAAGNEQAIAGSVRIGTSDAYLSDAVAAQNPDILDIPLAISAQTINYNLPGLNGANIKLDGPTVAAIYSGTVSEWDDPRIKAMNSDAALPHHIIVPIHRADGSGTTFVFTQFLDFSTETWENNPGYGTIISWPDVPGAKTAVGNEGIVETLAATPYAIGYVGTTYGDQITKAGLGTAMIKNQAGKFLLPTPQSITAAAAHLDPRTPPYERITLVYAPGDDSYPLINYEYAVVSRRQPTDATAKALRSFLRWAISETGGNQMKYLAPVDFIPLPNFIRGLSEAQIDEIK